MSQVSAWLSPAFIGWSEQRLSDYSRRIRRCVRKPRELDGNQGNELYGDDQNEIARQRGTTPPPWLLHILRSRSSCPGQARRILQLLRQISVDNTRFGGSNQPPI
jgi:hypothetical protein